MQGWKNDSTGSSDRRAHRLNVSGKYSWAKPFQIGVARPAGQRQHPVAPRALAELVKKRDMPGGDGLIRLADKQYRSPASIWQPSKKTPPRITLNRTLLKWRASPSVRAVF